MARILDPNGNYTFSKYADFTQPTAEVLAEFNYSYQREELNLIEYQGEVNYITFLEDYLKRNIKLVNPTVEIAIREFLIAPIVAEIGYHTNSIVYSEYTLNLNNLLKGTFDYYLKNQESLLIIEAKNGELRRGFTQLAVEMIALDIDLTSNSSTIYGAVTNGDLWKFGILNRETKAIIEDIKLYKVPEELSHLVRVLVKILKNG